MTTQVKKVRAADSRAMSGGRTSALNVGNQKAEWGLFIDGRQVACAVSVGVCGWMVYEGNKPFGLVIGTGTTRTEAADKAFARLLDAGY